MSQAIDPIAHTGRTIGHTHAKAHMGELWAVSDFDDAILPVAPKYWHIKTVAGFYAHLRLDVIVSDEVLVQWSEGPTLTADGTPLTPINTNRNSPGVANTLFYKDPTVTGQGLILVGVSIPGGSPVQSRIGSTARTGAEWILKADVPTSYLLKAEVGNANTNVSLVVEFYDDGKGRP